MSSQRLITAPRCRPAGFACAVCPRRSRAQQSPGLSAAWGCSRSPSHSGIPLPAPCAARVAVSWLCECRPAAVSWKARGDISANASQTRSDTSVVMCRLTLSPPSLLSQPLPRAPESRQVGQVRPSRVRVVSTARGLPPGGAGNARAPPRALCMWLGAAASAEALGHLCLPIRRLIPSCIGAPLRTAKVNVILIFLSVLKASGSGALTAPAGFCTFCSILMENTQITAQLRKGFCFWLCGTC